MRAVVFERYGGVEQLVLRDRPVPVPRADEVRIRVHAVSVNDWDWQALHGTPWLNRWFFGLRRPHRQILGSDISGTVESVGCNVHVLRPGDQVFGDLSGTWGGLAEYVCARERALWLKPEGMTHAQAAALPQAGLLALQGLEYRGTLQPGQRLLINGAGGGVGTFALQLARRLGAVVTAVDAADKAPLLRSLGAAEVIDHTREDFARSRGEFDVILDSRSTRSPFACAAALARGGRYVTVGGDMPRLLSILLWGPLVRLLRRRRVCILGLKINHGLERLAELFGAGELAPVIDGRYPLEDSREAFRRFGSGRHLGKVVIEVH